MHQSKCLLVAALLGIITLAKPMSAAISLGSLNRTVTVAVGTDAPLQSVTTDLFPLGQTRALQDSVTIQPTDFTAGATASASSQMTTAFSFDSINGGSSPSGHSYNFAVGGTTSIANTGQIETLATINTTIVFTLTVPTAWTLAEQASDGGAGMSGGDLQFWGAQLYAGQPQFPSILDSLLPGIGEVYTDGGHASGVLAPGTCTYIVTSGGNDDHDIATLTASSNFSLTETPEPVL